MKRIQKLLTTCAASLYVLLAASGSAYAEDIEIYTNQSASPNSTPMLFFFLDSSGSMNWCMTSEADCGGNASSRKANLQRAMNKLLIGGGGVTPIPGNVKVGLGHFTPSAPWGGIIAYPARALDNLVEIAPDGVVSSNLVNGNSDAEYNLTANTQLLNGVRLDMMYESVSVEQTIGLQFGNIRVPKKATISNAYIRLTAKGTSDTAQDPTWKIKVEDRAGANSPDFSVQTVEARTYHGDEVTVTPADWVAESTYDLSVTSLVQKVVREDDWCGGQNMAFRIADITSGKSPFSRQAYTYEADSSKAAKLFVEFSVDPTETNSCIVMDSTVSSVPGSYRNDVEWEDNTGGYVSSSYTETSTRLDFDEVRTVNTGTRSRPVYDYRRTNVALRYPTVNVPKSVTIVKATLDGVAGDSSGGVAAQTVDVGVYQSDNMPALCAPTGSCALRSLSLTTQDWSPGTISSGTAFGPDITPLVQEIVNRSGWVSGRAMGFRLRQKAAPSSTSVNNNLDFLSDDASGSAGPTLTVKYQTIVRDLSTFTTVREELNNYLQTTMPFNAATPLATAYSEVGRYLMGSNVGENLSAANVKNPKGCTEEDRDTCKYVSPIAAGSQCSGNHVVMLTDGAPSNDGGANVNTTAVIGANCNTDNARVADNGNVNSWNCAFDMAQWLMNKGRVNASTTKNQRDSIIHTNTVLFGPAAVSNTDLKAIAETYGGGKFYQSGNETELVRDLTEVVNALLETSASIAAPGVAVNQLNRFQYLDQIFYSMFEPGLNNVWRGNLKRYRMQGVGTSSPKLVDKDGADAVDSATYYFSANAWSYGSSARDGTTVDIGGAAEDLDLSSGSAYRVWTTRSATAALEELHENNTALVDTYEAAPTTLGLTASAGATEVDQLVKWARGVDTDINLTTPNKYMGDPLHAQPVMVNFGYTGSDALAAASNPDLQKNVLFVSTNAGYLHAIRAGVSTSTPANNFDWRWSYLPYEYVGNLATVKTRTGTGQHIYGLDGTWTVWRKDANNDGQITTGSSGDFVRLYAGVRDGGSYVYALDVTGTMSTTASERKPSKLWQISGGSTGAYRYLGKTWSQPVRTKVKISGVATDVILFGGGYDSDNESAGAFATDSYGHQLYMVNAVTGDLIWWASDAGKEDGTSTISVHDVSSMDYSVTGRVRVLDKNGDGYADHLYFGDLGGQLFRVDIDNDNNGSAVAATDRLVKRVARIASLGEAAYGSGEPSKQRRFYEMPDVGIVSGSSGAYVLVAIGSGYRSHPLNTTVKDRLYALRDTDAMAADILSTSKTLSTVMVDADLLDVSSTAAPSSADLSSKRGWFIQPTDSGEKAMASPTLIGRYAVFTTYVPNAGAPNSCAPTVGLTYAWVLDAYTTAPASDVNGDGSITTTDRRQTAAAGLSGGGTVMSGDPDACGAECTTCPTGQTKVGSRCCVDADNNGQCDENCAGQQLGTTMIVGTTAINTGTLGSGCVTRTRWYEKRPQ